ncbi:uncharacterized protein MONOS_18068 [Monocercomonoides exilis]|uniref:uncharacterized protein n=1 Tax=Monocercomonoides exilis TaxID=2049356 RepID=UPI00355A876B|nr:hypothetical protein MONOS_18068 [Monocercomonoides exilis]
MSRSERVGRREQREMKVKEQGGMVDETHLVVWLLINDHVGKSKRGGLDVVGSDGDVLLCNEEEEEEEEGDGRGSWQSASRSLWKGVGKKKSREAGIEMEWKGRRRRKKEGEEEDGVAGQMKWGEECLWV